MPRKLKTFLTTAGFFEVAVAAPSMKAALEIWGAKINLFHLGLAQQTDDSEIVRATLEHPGIVLRRPVGTRGAFKEQADFPKLSTLEKTGRRPRMPEPPAKKAQNSERPTKTDAAASSKAARLYDLAQKRREHGAEAERQKERKRRQRDIAKAQAALDKAKARHEKQMAEIDAQRDWLDRKADIEKERWEEEREHLEADYERARR